ncbi:uncharacterized protein BT62DRAFT_1012462 [Guyanagaster necrorhizus]|uniref:Uncharacterized protein n=1 Tax=Guyanagaster necrorhizus TaxID=856835 RepID=A0A9P8AMA8_9AGAR|nr:uncharacterized protein BT62DRAFT_1012462 [Guyanagaster necrorhizus MCA 3950]KAG7440690.1 hypothetical protein BT62DRAFT_1012462 [Guyanagaster necrorhizus MCA 3950]
MRIPTIVSADTNVGVFVEAILNNLSITLPSKYVLRSGDDGLSFGDLLDLWAETLSSEAEYVHVTEEETDPRGPPVAERASFQGHKQ